VAIAANDHRARGWAWFGAAFGASLVFALVESLEFMLAEWLQERRGETVEPDQ